MPEGPELRHSRDRLRAFSFARSIVTISLGAGGRYASNPPVGFDVACNALPLRISGIDVHGKFMWWTFIDRHGCERYMHVTYGMSGQWSPVPGKHVCCTLTLDTGARLHFNDPRHFGTLKFVSSRDEHRAKLASLGPDVLGSPPSPVLFAQRLLLKPQRTISEALMDQSCVSGVGNYIKAEALYRAGVSPFRVVSDMSSEEHMLLRDSVVNVCAESYAAAGASIRTYKTVDDEKGRTQFAFRVYGHKNCVLGHPVRRDETPDGRTSWWCETCQR